MSITLPISSRPPRFAAPAASAGHMLQLDGLRALAVLAVIVQHTFDMPNALNVGRAGVRLFFVLSGFLITRILLQARARSADTDDAVYAMRSFYGRRLLRIFPLYYFVLAAAGLLAVPWFRDYAWSLVTYTANLQAAYSGDAMEQPFGHFWSLAVEEQFYVLWPGLMLFLPARWLLPSIVLTIVVGPLSRLALVYAGRGVTYEFMTTSCLDTLGAGALLAFLKESTSLRPATYRRIVNGALGAGIMTLGVIALSALLAHAVVPARVLLNTAYMFIFAWLVARAADGFGGWGQRLLECRPLVYLGTISYGIYVYHYFVPTLSRMAVRSLGLDLAVPTSGLLLCIYVTLVTIAVATASWFLFEKPLNALKHHFPYQRRPMVVVKVAAARPVLARLEAAEAHEDAVPVRKAS